MNLMTPVLLSAAIAGQNDIPLPPPLTPPGAETVKPKPAIGPDGFQTIPSKPAPAQGTVVDTFEKGTKTAEAPKAAKAINIDTPREESLLSIDRSLTNIATSEQKLLNQFTNKDGTKGINTYTMASHLAKLMVPEQAIVSPNPSEQDLLGVSHDMINRLEERYGVQRTALPGIEKADTFQGKPALSFNQVLAEYAHRLENVAKAAEINAKAVKDSTKLPQTSIN